MKWLKKAVKNWQRQRVLKLTPAELHEMVSLSPLFKDVSDDNVSKMLEQSDTIQVHEAEIIMRQGDDGDYYYIVLDGMVSVLRRKSPQDKPHVAAVLSPGYGFGEEALISNRKRNATVMMETDGLLLRIPKQAFVDYIMNSLVTWVLPLEAQKRVNAGSRWLDVRDAGDFRRSHLHGAMSFPLTELHDHLEDLDRATPYVCCCENGRLSATAAFIMRQSGYDVCVLQGGLQRLERRAR